LSRSRPFAHFKRTGRRRQPASRSPRTEDAFIFPAPERTTEFDYLIPYATDVEEGADWYRERLGLDPEVETPGFVRVRGDRGVGVAIHQGDPLSTPERVQLEFRVDDLDATYERLREAGVTFAEPPQENPAGFRYVTTSDPAGHTVELRSAGE